MQLDTGAEYRRRGKKYLASMSLQPEEKELVSRALQLYAQMIGQQYGPAEMQALIPMIKDILKKLDQVGSAPSVAGKPPHGISQEWFDSVCSNCDKAGGSTGCTDPVTAKFPGKCDPILRWERAKILKG